MKISLPLLILSLASSTCVSFGCKSNAAQSGSEDNTQASGGSSTGGSTTSGQTGGEGSDRGNGGSSTGGSGASAERRNCDGSTVPPLSLTLITSDVSSPIYITSDPTDATRLFILEQTGEILLFQSDTITNVGSIDVNSEGERGLHSMAFHPQFDGTNEKRIYLAYSASGSGDTQVDEYTLMGDSIDPTAAKTIFEQKQPNGNHNGGQLQFGPDGYLYFGLGDGGSSCDANHGRGFDNNQAVNLQTPLGSMIRLNVDNLSIYPEGNISTDTGNDGRILHYGLRNPWRFSFDRGTGDLYIADVGQNAWEEVDVLPAGKGSTNFGWPGKEGSHDSSASDCDAAPDPDPTALDPIYEYPSSQGHSITGGYVYRGKAIVGLQGRYIFADYDSNRLWTLTWDGKKMCDDAEISDIIDTDGVLRGISSFGEDANGELYIATINGNAGVYRIDPK